MCEVISARDSRDLVNLFIALRVCVPLERPVLALGALLLAHKGDSNPQSYTSLFQCRVPQDQGPPAALGSNLELLR